MALPSSLQSLTFGWCSNQSLEEVVLPSILQSLIFDRCFNQSLRRRSEPANSPELYSKALENWQAHTLGDDFNQSLERLAFARSLQSLTFASTRAWKEKPCQMLFRAWHLVMISTRLLNRWPCHAVFKAWHLAAITIGAWAEWPCQAVLRAWGSEVSLTSNKSLDGVALPSNLQSLTFGLSFDQTLKQVALPSSLESLTFG